MRKKIILTASAVLILVLAGLLLFVRKKPDPAAQAAKLQTYAPVYVRISVPNSSDTADAVTLSGESGRQEIAAVYAAVRSLLDQGTTADGSPEPSEWKEFVLEFSDGEESLTIWLSYDNELVYCHQLYPERPALVVPANFGAADYHVVYSAYMDHRRESGIPASTVICTPAGTQMIPLLSQPETESEVLSWFQPGQMFSAQRHNETFARVQWAGLEGYVLRSDLQRLTDCGCAAIFRCAVKADGAYTEACAQQIDTLFRRDAVEFVRTLALEEAETQELVAYLLQYAAQRDDALDQIILSLRAEQGWTEAEQQTLTLLDSSLFPGEG